MVTGTLVDGTISVDDTLALFPGAATTRVRSIQTHEESVETIGPGNRTALNMVGMDREDVVRGSMLGVASGSTPGVTKAASRTAASAATTASSPSPWGHSWRMPDGPA